MYTTLQYTLQTGKEAAVMTTLSWNVSRFCHKQKCSLFDDYMYNRCISSGLSSSLQGLKGSIW